MKILLTIIAVLTGISISLSHKALQAPINPYKKINSNYFKIIDYNPAFCDGFPSTCYYDLPPQVTACVVPTSIFGALKTSGTLSYTGLICFGL